MPAPVFMTDGESKNMAKKKMVIGILGGIGSGKSTVARCFEPLGCAVIEADALAHDVLLEQGAKEDIVRLFGEQVLDVEGQVDRTSLATGGLSKIANDYENRKELLMGATLKRSLRVVKTEKFHKLAGR
jgi:dephospho-CoA kinase